MLDHIAKQCVNMISGIGDGQYKIIGKDGAPVLFVGDHMIGMLCVKNGQAQDTVWLAYIQDVYISELMPFFVVMFCENECDEIEAMLYAFTCVWLLTGKQWQLEAYSDAQLLKNRLESLGCYRSDAQDEHSMRNDHWLSDENINDMINGLNG